MPNISTGMYVVLFLAVIVFTVFVPWPYQAFIVLAVVYFLSRRAGRNFIPVPLSDRVSATIKCQFAPDEVEQVGNLLLLYGVQPSEKDVERIRLDVLELANGDLSQVAHWMNLAKKDYRDLIMAAEYQLVDGKMVRKPGCQ